MKETMNQSSEVESVKTLDHSELIAINGGEDFPDLIYLAGYSAVLTAAHYFTGGLSTAYLLAQKLLS